MSMETFRASSHESGNLEKLRSFVLGVYLFYKWTPNYRDLSDNLVRLSLFGVFVLSPITFNV